MSLLAIRNAFEEALDALNPPLPTAWENVSFTPEGSEPYQRVTLLPGMPDNPVFGPNFYQALGLFQVSLCYPLHDGSAAAFTRAELIRTTFPRGLSLTNSGIVVTVERTPEIGVAVREVERYVVPVRIRWFANINS